MKEKNKNMNTVVIIPARYASTRLPGKPLADINGKPMVQYVYERVLEKFKNVFVATDDERIERVVSGFSGRSVMTDINHSTGTDRCFEAVQKIEQKTGKDFDVVINVQGDEPLIDIEQITVLEKVFENPAADIATLIKKVHQSNELFDVNSPKVVVDKNLKALYFSRQAIPYLRDKKKELWHNNHIFYKHIGLYAYRKDVLKKITQLEQSSLELSEKLEQNRWLENGFSINCSITEHESFSVDTKQDLEKINIEIRKHF